MIYLYFIGLFESAQLAEPLTALASSIDIDNNPQLKSCIVSNEAVQKILNGINSIIGIPSNPESRTKFTENFCDAFNEMVKQLTEQAVLVENTINEGSTTIKI